MESKRFTIFFRESYNPEWEVGLKTDSLDRAQAFVSKYLPYFCLLFMDNKLGDCYRILRSEELAHPEIREG